MSLKNEEGEKITMKIEFDDEYRKTMTMVSEFEKKESYESAYLIKWQLIEKAVKEVAKVVRKKKLITSLESWLSYFNNPDLLNKPKEIKNFAIDSNSLPAALLVDEYFGKSLLNVNEVLDSSKKYRLKRNAIAHNFEPFGKATTYEVYSKKLDLAIEELRNELSNGLTD